MSSARSSDADKIDLGPATSNRFNLLRDPWLDCAMGDGGIRTLGLMDVLDKSHEISYLNVDDPMQDAPLFRTLLAFLYAALDPVTMDEWKQIWNMGRMPTDKLEEYADRHVEEFWLHSPSKGYCQTPSAEPAGGLKSLKPLSSLIQTPNGKGTLFPNMAGNAAVDMTDAQLARWVITCNAYDRCAAHGGFVGDPALHKGISYASMPFLGQLTVVRLKTGNLFTDLMLSLIPLDSGLFVMDAGGSDSVDDLFSFAPKLTAGEPAWEKPDLVPGEDGTANDKLRPVSLQDCLTWRSRRIKIYYDSDGVASRVMLSPGQHVTVEDQMGLEPMAAWKAVQAKKDAPINWIPLRYSAEKSFWRGLPSLLAATDDSKPPMTLRWAAKLSDDGLLTPGYVGNVTVETCRYDSSMSSLVTDYLVDKVDLPVSLVEDPAKTQIVKTAIGKAEDAVRSYGLMVQRIRVASGEDMETAASERQKQQSIAYDLLGERFMEWLQTVVSSDSPLEEWWSIVRSTARDLAENYAGQAPVNAIIGRVIDGTAYSVATSRMKFYAGLKSIGRGIESEY